MGEAFGVQEVLRGSVNSEFPFSFAETPGGLLLMANGIDRMLKWDGLASSADTVGITSPATPVQVGGLNAGTITGQILAFVRFYDALGNFSDLSPVSNLMNAGFDGMIDGLDYDKSSGAVTITSMEHNLSTGDVVVISGVEGISRANGQWAVTVVGPDAFTLQGLSVTAGEYTQHGQWTYGVLTVVYGAVSLPTDSKVVGRQILRNLSGTLESLYVDIDTRDLTSTVFSSNKTDAQLVSSTPVPLFYPVSSPVATDNGELPYANRHAVPPTHKSVIVPHKGLIFAAVDAVYSAGHAEPVFGSTKVQGVGTAWQATFVGRSAYFASATRSYQIADVDHENQTITLASPYMDMPVPYTLYSIQPDPGERRLLYFTEPGLPESWPTWNAIAVPEDEDELVGLLSMGQYIYIFEKRHVYRYTFQADPSDGMVFLVSHRGALSQRMLAYTDAGVYAMDEIGIHKFDGDNESESISMVIQNVFQGDGTSDLQVDWSANQTQWHCAWNPVRDTIRWFVAMEGFGNLQHAICYNYRTNRFWIEYYPVPMTASCNATIGSRRSFAGTFGRRVVCLSQGNYDGISGVGTLYGTCTSGDQFTINDTAASFPDLEGVVVCLVGGAGAGQQSIIAANTATSLTVIQPFSPAPDSSSTYQVGGIPWAFRTGWFRLVDEEDDNPRDIDITYKPLTVPGKMYLQLYFDHSLTPRVWARDIQQDGIQTWSGSPLIEIDMSQPLGWARQRLSGHGSVYSFADRFVSVELSGVQAGEPLRVSQVIVTGVETS